MPLWIPISIPIATACRFGRRTRRGTKYPTPMLARLKESAARPTSPKFSMSTTRSLATAAAMSTSSTSAEPIFTGRSRRAAKAGARARIAMPIATGTSTIAKTWMTLSNCSGITLPSPTNCSSEKLTINGSVSSESRLLTAVRVMLSATSPRARWLYRLAVAPPGDAARSMSPTASTGWSPKPTAIL